MFSFRTVGRPDLRNQGPEAMMGEVLYLETRGGNRCYYLFDQAVIREPFAINQLVTGGNILFAPAMIALAYVRSFAELDVALIAASPPHRKLS